MHRAAGVAIAAVLSASAALAGDSANRKVIGFSPDGTIFAFEQYTQIYEDEASFSEYFFIDTRTDRYLPGTPIKVLLRDDDGNDTDKASEQAAAKAAPLIKQHRIEQSGTRIEGKPSASLDDFTLYHMSAQSPAKTLAVALPDGRKAALLVAERPLGKALCDGGGGTATPGKVDVRGLRLTLTLDGKPTVLHEDKTLPKARRCVSGYGIAEAYLHTAPDGTITLVALLETIDNDGMHAGPNRRFMAVTRRLAPK